MTAVGPPEFDSGAPERAVDPSEPAPVASRRWLVPVFMGVVALIVGARLVSPAPEAPPPPGSTSTTVAPRPTISRASSEGLDYTGTGVSVVVQAMTAAGGGYRAFAAGDDAGQLILVSSANGIRWGKDDGVVVTGLAPGSEPRGMWPIPGTGVVLGAFNDVSGTEVMFATAGRGARWQQVASFSEPDGRQIRPVLVVPTPIEAVVNLEERREAGQLPRRVTIRLDLASGDLTPVEAIGDESVRAAAYDVTYGSVLAVLSRRDEPGPPGSNHRFAWLVDGIWVPVTYPTLEPFDVVSLGTWSGRIVAFTSTEAHVYDAVSDTWATSEAYGPPGRSFLTAATGPGGAVVVTREPAIVGGRTHVGLSTDLMGWRDVEIVDELINVQLEAVGTDEAILEAFAVGAGLQRLSVPFAVG